MCEKFCVNEQEEEEERMKINSLRRNKKISLTFIDVMLQFSLQMSFLELFSTVPSSLYIFTLTWL